MVKRLMRIIHRDFERLYPKGYEGWKELAGIYDNCLVDTLEEARHIQKWGRWRGKTFKYRQYYQQYLITRTS